MEIIDAFQAGLGERSRLENLLALEEVVDQAARQGVLSPLPQEKSQVITNAYIKTRLRTVRSRLVRLGYLEEEEPRRGQLYIGVAARRAIRQFQTEAGLTVDGWVGPETWNALEELVSFEHPISADTWLAKPPDQQQALWRATRLRLSVLGLPRLPKPCLRRADALPGLARFLEVAVHLKMAEPALTAQDTRETLDLLFDQDALVRRLGAVEGAFAFEHSTTGKLAQRFVTCVARIELWLLGAEIQLSANSDPEYSLRDLHPTAALYNFWRLQDEKIGSARALSRQDLDPGFFQELYAATTGAPDAQEQADLGEWLYKRLRRQDSSLRQPLWETLQELGSRMWDGIRRVWNWVKDRLQHFSRTLKSWVLNLARLTHDLALKAFVEVRKSVERLAQAVRFGMPGMLPGSKAPDFFLLASGDLDYTLFVSQPAQVTQVRALAREMRQHAHDFGAILQVLSSLLAVLAATSIPGGGWIVFLVALARGGSQIKQAAQAFS